MKVALGAAKGLAFLHSDEAKVIYRDFKSSNILLDSVCETIHPFRTYVSEIFVKFDLICFELRNDRTIMRSSLISDWPRMGLQVIEAMFLLG